MKTKIILKTYTKIFLFIIFSFVIVGCDSVKRNNKSPMRTVSKVEASKFLGEWHVAARTPSFFEKKCVNSRAIYSVTKDPNVIGVLNICDDKTKPGKTIEVRGTAKILNKENTKFKVKLNRFPGNLFDGKLWVIRLDEQNYQWAVLSEPSGRYLWIISRDQVMNEGLLQDLVLGLYEDGWDVDSFIYDN